VFVVQAPREAFKIKLMAEAIEFTLLGAAGVSRGSGGFGFEGAMHTLMATVLLWFTGFDELGHDAQSYPPCGELGETGQGVGGERHPVVSADTSRQSEFLEQASEHRFGFSHASGSQCLAAKQEAAETIGHSKGITVQSIAGFELSLEVGTPPIVGGQDLADGLARMTNVWPTALLGHQSMATENVAHSGASRETPTPMALTATIACSICSGVRLGQLAGLRESSSRPCGPRRR